MPLSISPELMRRLEEKVESGEYESVEEVVSHAMRALSRREEKDKAKLDEGSTTSPGSSP